jgi:hypothetical protein
MFRWLGPLLVVVMILFYLQSRVGEQEQSRVEKQVDINAVR